MLNDKLDNAHARFVESDQISLKVAKIATEIVEMKSKLDKALTEKRIYKEKMQLWETLIEEKNNTGSEISIKNLMLTFEYNFSHMLRANNTPENYIEPNSFTEIDYNQTEI